jgi:hypothetical protein
MWTYWVLLPSFYTLNFWGATKGVLGPFF